MLNITNHWENASISINEISPYTWENDHPQRDSKQKVSVRMWRKGNSQHCYWSVNWISHYGKQYGGFPKN